MNCDPKSNLTNRGRVLPLRQLLLGGWVQQALPRVPVSIVLTQEYDVPVDLLLNPPGG